MSAEFGDTRLLAFAGPNKRLNGLPKRAENRENRLASRTRQDSIWRVGLERRPSFESAESSKLDETKLTAQEKSALVVREIENGL